MICRKLTRRLNFFTSLNIIDLQNCESNIEKIEDFEGVG